MASTEPVRGIDLDDQGRCAHWHGPTDVIAIRFPCCNGWFACWDCHRELADHPPQRWPREAFGARAVLCGACRTELTIEAYLSCDARCPACRAAFNPRCERHHPLYFELRSG